MLIIDSGSTKADWAYIIDDEVSFFQTEGINPLFQSTEEMVEIIRKSIPGLNLSGSIGSIYFYGASCSSDERIAKVSTAFEHVFASSNISVTHDLLGAARATCGHSKGIIGILGTGSSAGSYDGQNILRATRSLGYILGDEGSGAWFGKQFISRYLYGQLDEQLRSSFRSEFPELDVDLVIDRVYRQPNPNRFLASFMQFIGRNKHHSYIKEMLKDGFDQFLKIHVISNKEAVGTRVHFVGSVAYYFQDELRSSLRSNHLKAGNILKKPIDGLVEFHRKTI